MPEGVPQSEVAARSLAEGVRRARLPARRDVRRAVAEAHDLDQVYAVEARPGGVIRYILKHEVGREVEPTPTTMPSKAKKENARQRKSRERKDAFHQKKRLEAAATKTTEAANESAGEAMATEVVN
jgi:hypothetical protein